MTQFLRGCVVAVALLLCMLQARAQQRPAIDGQFDDWNTPPLHRDAVGDAGAAGIDLVSLWVENDDDWLYIAFETVRPVLLQEGNGLQLWIDSDANENTGTRNGTVGAELVWRFGQRSGTVVLGGSSKSVKHADIGIIPAPSITSTRFELALRRSTVVNGRALFAGQNIRIALVDASDRLPDGTAHVAYGFHTDAFDPVPPLGLEPAPGTIRLLSWNTAFSGMMDAARAPAYGRLLRAIMPDVIVFNEVFDHTSTQVLAFVNGALPAPTGRTWQARKVDAGNVLVSHLPIEEAVAVQSNYRESAFLLRRPDGGRLCVLAMHLRCCDADAERQREADGVIGFLRDAMRGAPGARMRLESDVPVVLAGDFNLVGDARQLETLVTGAIVDTLRYGSPFAPDRGTAPLAVLHSRSPRSLFATTWNNPTGTYTPGILDYILFTAGTLEIPHHLVVRSDEFTPAERAALGVDSLDVEVASDHMPRVADLRVRTVSARTPPPLPSSGMDVWPQPLAAPGMLVLAHGFEGMVDVMVWDATGRLVDAGMHAAVGGVTRLRWEASATGSFVVTIRHGKDLRSRVVRVY